MSTDTRIAGKANERTYSNCVLKSRKPEEVRCRALIDDGCKNPETCAFHRTEAERAAALESCRRRMNDLSLSAQIYYADKYYGGDMPWKRRQILPTEHQANTVQDSHSVEAIDAPTPTGEATT